MSGKDPEESFGKKEKSPYRYLPYDGSASEAEYHGTCPLCHQSIIPGDSITWWNSGREDGTLWVHTNCVCRNVGIEARTLSRPEEVEREITSNEALIHEFEQGLDLKRR